MKRSLTIAGIAAAALLAPMLSHATDADKDRTTPAAFVKDSAITTKIKSKLATERLSSLAKIHVDTDADGIVYLSGHARSQSEIDKVVAIASGTEHVKAVKNELVVKADD